MRSRPTSAGTDRASDREPVTLDGVIEDVAGLAPARFTLVGYSMGGRIALHAALAPALKPRIDRLVLIGASPGSPTRSSDKHDAPTTTYSPTRSRA